MIMKGPWKVINFFEDNSFKLYNIEKDLSESKDLSSEYPEVAKSLIEELKKWQQETKAVIPTVENDKFSSAERKSKKN